MAARRSARNSPVLTKRRRGLKGEPSPGVPPLRAAPAARSLCAPPWGWRWTKERVVGDADPYRAGAATRGLRSSRRPGGGGTPPLRGPAERGKAGGDRDGGTSGTPSPTGLVRRRRAGGNLRQGSSRTPTPTGPCGTGRVPRDFPGAGHNAGNGENAAGGGVLISFAGRRGRRPLRGWRGSLRWRVCLARYLFTAPQRGGVPSPPGRRFATHPILK